MDDFVNHLKSPTLGWLCTRHNRHEYWPIVKEEYEEGMPLNQCSVSTSEDIASLDNPFTYEFENIDEDDGERELLRSPVCSPGEFVVCLGMGFVFEGV